MTQGKFDMRTPDGYDYYELISALQKDIRRGKEDTALVWALKLAGNGFMPHLLNRLPIIANEDIGISDGGTTIILVDTLCSQIKTYFDKKNDAWYVMLSNAILAMCRAVKTREAENFQTVVRSRLRHGWKPEIPDYALDKHTRRGKAMGRDLAFFVKHEQQKSTLHNPGQNHYVDEANRIELGGEVEIPGSEEQPEADQGDMFGGM